MQQKKWLIIALVIIVITGTVVLVYPQVQLGAEKETKDRIAYVDVWEVFNAHPEKKAAEKELNQLAQSMQSELEQKAKDLPKNEQQDMLKEYQSKLSQEEQKLIQDILDTIKEVIVKVAEEKEVRMVLDKKNVIYGGYDMTQDVIEYIQQSESAENNQGK